MDGDGAGARRRRRRVARGSTRVDGREPAARDRPGRARGHVRRGRRRAESGRRITAHRGRAGDGRSGARRRRMVGRPWVVARRFVASAARAPPRDGDRCAPHRSRARRVRMARHARRHPGGVVRRRRVAAGIPVVERRGRPEGLGAWGRRPSGGRDPPARRSRLPRRARPSGHGGRAERRRRRALGVIVEPVHPCGTGVPGVRRPVDRASVPGARGGVAPRAGVGGRIPTGRRHDARFPGERARPPAGGVGRERRDGAGSDPRAGLAAPSDPVAPVRSWAPAPSRSSS